MSEQFTLILESIDYDPNWEGTGDGLVTIELNAENLKSGAKSLQWSEWITDGKLERVDSQDSCGHNDAGCWDLLTQGERPAVEAMLETLTDKLVLPSA